MRDRLDMIWNKLIVDSFDILLLSTKVVHITWKHRAYSIVLTRLDIIVSRCCAGSPFGVQTFHTAHLLIPKLFHLLLPINNLWLLHHTLVNYFYGGNVAAIRGVPTKLNLILYKEVHKAFLFFCR